MIDYVDIGKGSLNSGCIWLKTEIYHNPITYDGYTYKSYTYTSYTSLGKPSKKGESLDLVQTGGRGVGVQTS